MKKRIFGIIGLILLNISSLGLIIFLIWSIFTSDGNIEFSGVSLVVFLILSELATISFTADYIFNKEKIK